MTKTDFLSRLVNSTKLSITSGELLIADPLFLNGFNDRELKELSFWQEEREVIKSFTPNLDKLIRNARASLEESSFSEEDKKKLRANYDGLEQTNEQMKAKLSAGNIDYRPPHFFLGGNYISLRVHHCGVGPVVRWPNGGIAILNGVKNPREEILSDIDTEACNLVIANGNSYQPKADAPERSYFRTRLNNRIYECSYQGEAFVVQSISDG